MKYFDCHCDTLTKAMFSGQDMYSNKLHNNIKKLMTYESPVQMFAIWLDKKYLDKAYKNTFDAIHYFNNQKEKYKDYITTDYNDTSKLRAILTVEGGEACEGSLEKLHYLYDNGIKLMTLTWNYKNEIGCGALSGFTDGLSDFGKKVVKEMNKLNMVIDVSHLNERGFWDVFETSQKPFVATHSNAYNVYNHPRNLKRDQIYAINESGGIIGLNLYPVFVDGDKGKTDNILRHIDYILNITEGENLALGSDFDGISYCCKEFKGVLDMYKLHDLIAKHFSNKVADDVFYNNMNRFLIKNNIV